MRPADIARTMGTSEWTIHHRLNRMGIKRRPSSLSPTQIIEAKRLYELGESVWQIHAKLGFSENTIRKVLKEAGVFMHGRLKT